jgi:hypothetical protein
MISGDVYFRGILVFRRCLFVTLHTQMVLMLRIQRDFSEDIIDLKKNQQMHLTV